MGDDGVFCNGEEACINNVCEAGDVPLCDDNDQCTTDLCVAELDTCLHLQDNEPCTSAGFSPGSDETDSNDSNSNDPDSTDPSSNDSNETDESCTSLNRVLKKMLSRR